MDCKIFDLKEQYVKCLQEGDHRLAFEIELKIIELEKNTH